MYVTNFCNLFLKNKVMLHLAMQCLYLDIILHSKNFASLEVKPMNMSRLSFASVFKLLNEEFGAHPKDDGEAVLESLNKEKEVEEETTDHVPQPNFKRKYTDTESDNDECEQFDELKQSLPNSEELVLDSFTSEKVTENFVLSNIGEFLDLNENDLSAADIAETTLKKLLDDVEKTSEHRQDQKKKKKKLLTEVERLKRGRDSHPILNVCSPISSKDGGKFTNIIGFSQRTIKIFGSSTWLKQ